MIVIAGNHDAANGMTRALRLPDNVHLLAHESPETVLLDDLGVAIHGQSFARPAVMENLAVAYPPPLAAMPISGYFILEWAGWMATSDMHPVRSMTCASRGYDYWALGHVHARQDGYCADPQIVFAGNVQGRHIREIGPKGCLLATIRPDRQIEPVFQRLDQVRWERASVDVAGLATESEILDHAAKMFDDLLASEPDLDAMLAVRVSFNGSTSLHGRLQTNPERFVAEFRSLATERGGDRLWVASARLHTRPLLAATVLDGPFDELVSVIEQLRSDPASHE